MQICREKNAKTMNFQCSSLYQTNSHSFRFMKHRELSKSILVFTLIWGSCEVVLRSFWGWFESGLRLLLNMHDYISHKILIGWILREFTGSSQNDQNVKKKPSRSFWLNSRESICFQIISSREYRVDFEVAAGSKMAKRALKIHSVDPLRHRVKIEACLVHFEVLSRPFWGPVEVQTLLRLFWGIVSFPSFCSPRFA